MAEFDINNLREGTVTGADGQYMSERAAVDQLTHELVAHGMDSSRFIRLEDEPFPYFERLEDGTMVLRYNPSSILGRRFAYENRYLYAALILTHGSLWRTS